MKKCANESKKDSKFYCMAADYEKCKGEGCAFYITEEAAQVSREKSNARLSSLTPSEQSGISEKYYHGETPWKNNSENI